MDIKAFNKLYGLPCASFPGAHALPNGDFRLRLAQLKVILQQEVNEIDDIIAFADAAGRLEDDSYRPINEEEEVDLLVMVADLMTDIQVYAQSEMVKWGLPIDMVHGIVMESNASKLQADGTALVVDGKLQKGPNYWKPEPRIEALVKALRAAAGWQGISDPPAPA